MLDHVSTRRVFLQKGLTLLAVSSTIPTFLDQTVLAIASPEDTKLTQQPSGADGKVLVVVQLSGGNDGLNTVVPYADDVYHRARPNIAVDTQSVLKVSDYLGLHPNLKPLREMMDKGLVSIIQGVGYPNPNRSHFRSMDIWHSGRPETEDTTSGWLGRYFDNTCPGCDPHSGVAIGESLPLAMKGQRVTPLSFDRPENYAYNGPDKQRYQKLNTAGDAGSEPTTQPLPSERSASLTAGRGKSLKPQIVTPDAQLDFLTRTAMDAQLSSDAILKMTRGHSPAAAYPPSEFGQGLRTIAAMIRGGLPTRVYYVTLGGFDTHANQRGRHDQLMNQFAQGVDAFWKDLKQQGNDQRVLMMTFSEFGRRVASNASGGTDHGAAAPMFLFGPACKQVVVGRHPSLTDLDQGDLRYSIDFRSVYATILQNWLDTPSKPILGQQFPTLNVLRA
ncbi:DUF1501 domain-containing protein [Fontivita pretiosa]|uniref:DUF1501 domain-containing protein n=1 Tax=Fontivita pretiosa TaxID=2989684 RepID=UPI003D17F95E